MTLSDKKKKELTKEYEEAHDKVLYLIEKHEGIHEQFVTFLLYLSTKNLVKHSKSLTRWTIVIGVSTILLFISAAMQFIKLFFFP